MGMHCFGSKVSVYVPQHDIKQNNVKIYQQKEFIHWIDELR